MYKVLINNKHVAANSSFIAMLADFLDARAQLPEGRHTIEFWERKRTTWHLIDGGVFHQVTATPAIDAVSKHLEVDLCSDGKRVWLGTKPGPIGVPFQMTPKYRTIYELEAFCQEHLARFKGTSKFIEIPDATTWDNPGQRFTTVESLLGKE